ncbi:unnamed protein product, partial [Musa textilis]
LVSESLTKDHDAFKVTGHCGEVLDQSSTFIVKSLLSTNLLLCRNKCTPLPLFDPVDWADTGITAKGSAPCRCQLL